MDYLILSAATDDSVYADCIKQQEQIFKHRRYLGLIFPKVRHWKDGTKIKPAAIREGFSRCDTVMWVDADCLINAPDAAPPGDWDVCTVENIHPLHKLKISAGFFMVRNTQGGNLFLNTWEAHNKLAVKDHPAMIKTLNMLRNQINIADMTDWLRGRHTINALMPERGRYAG